MLTGDRPWPKRSTFITKSNPSGPSSVMSGGLRPIVLPKFMSNPGSFEETGYQKAHLLYDEMRKFFARKASAENQNEVVVIKFTMMMLKPGHKSPTVVSVCNGANIITQTESMFNRISRKLYQIFPFILALRL